jgi:hypothetical protein
MTTWQLQPLPPVHAMFCASTQNIPEQQVAFVVHVVPIPPHVCGAWQENAPPSGLSQVRPEQQGSPDVWEQAAPLPMHVPASGSGGAHR